MLVKVAPGNLHEVHLSRVCGRRVPRIFHSILGGVATMGDSWVCWCAGDGLGVGGRIGERSHRSPRGIPGLKKDALVLSPCDRDWMEYVSTDYSTVAVLLWWLLTNTLKSTKDPETHSMAILWKSVSSYFLEICIEIFYHFIGYWGRNSWENHFQSNGNSKKIPMEFL